MSSNAEVRQQVTAIVDRDVKDTATDATLIARGTPVVISADIRPARGVGKPASVVLTCVSTTSVDGQEILLQGSYSDYGESNKSLSLGLGIGVGVFVWPALFCLCIKGEKINLPNDLLIHHVVVNDDYTIAAR